MQSMQAQESSARPQPWQASLRMQVRDGQIQRKYRKYTRYKEAQTEAGVNRRPVQLTGRAEEFRDISR